MKTKENQKKNKVKTIIISIIVIVILLIAIIAYFFISGSKSTEDTSYKINTTANLENYSLLVRSAKNTNNLDNKILSNNDSYNNFFLVNLSVEDISNGNLPSLDLTKNPITLDSNGTTYNVNDNMTMELSQNKISDYLTAFSSNGTLKSKETYSVPLVFETNGPVTNGKLKVTINNKSITFNV
ncbi:MAG: hypothetical protein ACRDD2_02370 [Sarcina sp.]